MAGLPRGMGVKAFIESSRFRNFIMTLIVFNAITLGLETYPYEGAWFTTWLPMADRIIVGVFVVEILLKLIVYRHRFFLNGWNWFDLTVIIISILPAAGGFSVLRALRIVRAFRLFSVMPDLRKVVEALLRAIPGMGAVMAVLGLMFYVSAVMATKFFSETNPERFGSLGESAFALFQVMTLEGWATDVALPVMEFHPWAWIFFLVFIVLTSFAVLNLFIAIIVDSLQAKHFDDEEARDAEADADRDKLHAEISGMRVEINRLTALVQRSLGEDPSASIAEKDADKSE
ncbi:voltage-gated sodium channel [Maricaulis maris]|uniref:Voltage-gated sodium channel n=2 Tax=Maricaulis maris TaxID=74318 RepID=A0A495D158_9PROT|nr:voltage-gated sodium channel [Maricaulis maris]